MDAFFVPVNEFQFPYDLRLWCASYFEKLPFLLTFDGVKIRLTNYFSREIINEVNFPSHEALSSCIAIYHPDYPSRTLFLIVQDRRYIVGYDEFLKEIPTMKFDSTLIILKMYWSESRKTIFISGQFGWLRALKLNIYTAITSSTIQWKPIWTKHEGDLWVNNLVADEKQGFLIGSSGTDIYVWNMDDGSLVMKFNTKHTMSISDIAYSDDHLMFFTASADGSIKSWRLFGRKANNVHTIKMPQVGPVHIQIDSQTILCISHERVLKRFNMMTGSFMGQLDLQPGVSAIEQKDVERPIRLAISLTDKGEYIFESEGGVIKMMQVHYAPRELAVCCEIVTSVVCDRKGRLFALCRNNILHELLTDGSTGKTFDLDTIKPMNAPTSVIATAVVSHMLLNNERLYFGFSNGEIKVLDLNTEEFYAMRDADIGNAVTALCCSEGILNVRHGYCSAGNNTNELFFHCSKNGAFAIHCPKCFGFVGSWKLSTKKVRNIIQLEDQNALLALFLNNLVIYIQEETILKEAYRVTFDDQENASCMAMVTSTLCLIGMKSGKGVVYDCSDHKLTSLFTLKLHSSECYSLIPCRDLLKIEDGAFAFHSEKLDGFCVSLGADNTLTIVNCLNGMVQYQCNLPVSTERHTATFCFPGKIMLALSVDQNVRLFDWPEFQRIEPPPSAEPEEEPIDSQQESSRTSNDKTEEEDEREQFTSYFAKAASQLSPVKEILSARQSPIKQQSDSPKKKRKVDLYFDENGWPKLKIEPLSEEEEGESTSIEELPPSEVEIEEPVKFDDFMDYDDLAEYAQEEQLQTLKTVKSKPIKAVTISEEEELSRFYDYYLALDIRHIPTGNRRSNSRSSDSRSSRFMFTTQPKKAIQPIGNRKSRALPNKRHYIIVTFADGTKMRTDEITADLLSMMASRNEATNSESLTPGYIFHKALTDLDKKEKAQKELIIHKNELVALPIQTITPGGLTIGANSRRFFADKKPNFEQIPSGYFLSKTTDSRVESSPYMHWEDVTFSARFGNRASTSILKMEAANEYLSTRYDEREEEDTNDSVGRDIIDKIIEKSKLQQRPDEDQFSEYRPVDTRDFNIFDRKDKLASRLVNASPSLKLFSELLGSSNDPLSDLINNAPVLTPEQLEAQLRQNRIDPIGTWKPQPGMVTSPRYTNTFSFEGLSGLPTPSGSGETRPRSPRALDAIAELTRKLTFNSDLLPIIPEISDGDSDYYSGDEDEWETNSYSSSASDVETSTPSFRPNQLVVQEHLQRNDFKALRDCLDSAGLLNNNDVLIDLPKWQPIVEFGGLHQKGHKAYYLAPGSHEQYEEEEEVIEEEEDVVDQVTGEVHKVTRKIVLPTKRPKNIVITPDARIKLSMKDYGPKQYKSVKKVLQRDEIPEHDEAQVEIVIDENGNETKVYKLSNGLTMKKTRVKKIKQLNQSSGRAVSPHGISKGLKLRRHVPGLIDDIRPTRKMNEPAYKRMGIPKMVFDALPPIEQQKIISKANHMPPKTRQAFSLRRNQTKNKVFVPSFETRRPVVWQPKKQKLIDESYVPRDRRNPLLMDHKSQVFDYSEAFQIRLIMMRVDDAKLKRSRSEHDLPLNLESKLQQEEEEEESEYEYEIEIEHEENSPADEELASSESFTTSSFEQPKPVSKPPSRPISRTQSKETVPEKVSKPAISVPVKTAVVPKEEHPKPKPKPKRKEVHRDFQDHHEEEALGEDDTYLLGTLKSSVKSKRRRRSRMSSISEPILAEAEEAILVPKVEEEEEEEVVEDQPSPADSSTVTPKKKTIRKKNLTATPSPILVKQQPVPVQQANDDMTDEDVQILEALLKSQATSLEVTDVDLLLTPSPTKAFYSENYGSSDFRSTRLGKQITISNEFSSLRLRPRKRRKEVFDGAMMLINSKSMNELMTKPDHDPDAFHILGEVNLMHTMHIHTEHYCPTLWRRKEGKMRRNSI